ncbi:MAG TPA: LytR C-terminal domain-containing protein [Actinomycetota bacterium]
MPGKHAPESPTSFYFSLGRSIVGALAVLALVILTVVVLVDSGGDATAVDPTGSATPTTTATTEPTTPATTPTPSEPSLRKRSKVRITVLNGVGVPGLAGDTVDRLERKGYERLVAADVDDDDPTNKTTIYFAGGFQGEGDRLLIDFPDLSRTRPMDERITIDASIVVILGDDYQAP